MTVLVRQHLKSDSRKVHILDGRYSPNIGSDKTVIPKKISHLLLFNFDTISRFL